MKKLFLFSVLMGFPCMVFAQSSLMSGVVTDYSVTNSSQDNQDATVVGASSGDVLRFKLTIESPTENVFGVEPAIDVLNIEDSAQIFDTGLGEVQDGILFWDVVNAAAPYKRDFTFFARVNPNCNASTITSAAFSQSLRVPLNCGLAKSGPGSMLVWGLLCVAFIGVLGFFRFSLHE